MATSPLDRFNIRGAVEAGLKAKQMSFDDRALAAILKSKVIGQDKVADQVTAQLKRRLSQLEVSKVNVVKPLGVFLLAGPPGVGKTYFCKVLAQNMYSGKGKMLQVDMTQYAQGHAKSSLIGAPQGYGGPGSLTKALKDKPNLIVILDEFEKASPEVHKIFLTAWNDGFITDLNTGEQIKTTQALFLATTNAAMEELQQIERSYADDPEGRERAVNQVLKQAGFAGEVLSRIDNVFVFDVLDKRNTGQLAAIEIHRLAANYGLTVGKIDAAYLFNLVTRVESEMQTGGARPLERILDRELGDHFIALARAGTKSARITLDEDDRLIVSSGDVAD